MFLTQALFFCSALTPALAETEKAGADSERVTRGDFAFWLYGGSEAQKRRRRSNLSHRNDSAVLRTEPQPLVSLSCLGRLILQPHHRQGHIDLLVERA